MRQFRGRVGGIVLHYKGHWTADVDALRFRDGVALHARHRHRVHCRWDFAPGGNGNRRVHGAVRLLLQWLLGDSELARGDGGGQLETARVDDRRVYRGELLLQL